MSGNANPSQEPLTQNPEMIGLTVDFMVFSPIPTYSLPCLLLLLLPQTSIRNIPYRLSSQNNQCKRSWETTSQSKQKFQNNPLLPPPTISTLSFPQSSNTLCSIIPQSRRTYELTRTHTCTCTLYGQGDIPEHK